MRNTHLSASLVFAASLGFVLGNCGGSSSSSGPVACPPGGSANCTQAELNQYTNCIIGKCGSTLQTCFGPNYQSGTYAGTCGTAYVSCTQKCGCGDNTACLGACGQPSSDCGTCLLSVSACIQTSTCTAPACQSGGAGGTTGGSGGTTGGGAGGHVAGQGGFTGGFGGITGTNGTCADLQTCCNAITTASVKAQCTAEYNLLLPMGDATCGAAVAGLRSGGVCP